MNVISTCRNILCVDINVDKRCVDHSTRLAFQSLIITIINGQKSIKLMSTSLLLKCSIISSRRIENSEIHLRYKKTRISTPTHPTHTRHSYTQTQPSLDHLTILCSYRSIRTYTRLTCWFTQTHFFLFRVITSTNSSYRTHSKYFSFVSAPPSLAGISWRRIGSVSTAHLCGNKIIRI